FVVKFKSSSGLLVNSLKIPPKSTRKPPSSTGRTGGDSDTTVWATGKTVAQTGFSLAQTVAGASVIGARHRLFAPGCKAAAVHVIGREIHVIGRVCKKSGVRLVQFCGLP
ncbi:MAG: hypothetical protein SOY69_01440, partial [Alloprevotella sp.]|nr:hypothetical protein [Alloprevotella sp.]